MSSSKALALRLPGLNACDGLKQWWQMATAKSFSQFEKALQLEQIPFFNVIYADKPGNIFYISNGLIPKRKQQAWEYWNRIIPGGKSEDVWTTTHPYSDLPKVKNPPQGWLQNTNDPAWYCTFPNVLSRSDFPQYMSPEGMSLRSQRSVEMFLADESISYEELIGYKSSTYLELADRVLDDLFASIEKYRSPSSQKAKAVLNKWDRSTNVDSRGAYLFYRWVHKMRSTVPDMFDVPWTSGNALTTPDGLKDPRGAVKALEETVKEMKEEKVALDIPWGDVCRLQMDSIDLPGNGIDSDFGTVRVAAAWSHDGILTVGGGDSWVGIIEFSDSVKASVLLSYGNSSQKGSPNRGDQLKMFSESKLRPARFYRNDVLKAKVSSETLSW
jgi:acyl-homoserine-lactone acylase